MLKAAIHIYYTLSMCILKLAANRDIILWCNITCSKRMLTSGEMVI